MRRLGITLVECIVVLGIVMILAAMVFPAIQQVRLVQAQMEIKSNLRSISLAMQSYAADRLGSLPGQMSPPFWGPGDRLPLLEYAKYVANEAGPFTVGMLEYPIINRYRSTTDASVQEYGLFVDASGGLCSYATNMLIHLGRPRMSTAITDGLSTTIYAGEHLAVTIEPAYCSNNYGIVQAVPGIPISGSPVIVEPPDRRYAAFANIGSNDVVPITMGNPPVSVPSIPGVSFQHRPSAYDAKSGLLHSTTPSGLLVGMCDGSTRCISPRVGVNVYWSLITPAGREMIPNNFEE